MAIVKPTKSAILPKTKKGMVIRTETKPIGRPSKYKPEYCQMLIEDMAQGYSFEAFAGKIGVSGCTLDEWVKAYPDFAAAKKDALEAGRRFWETMGIASVNGMREGRYFNSTTWSMTMKNRFGYRDRSKEEMKDEISAVIDKTKELELLKKLLLDDSDDSQPEAPSEADSKPSGAV